MATDLGAGSPIDESLKRCLVAARLARRLGCSDSEVRDVVYVALLEHLGCTAFAHENAGIWGDEIVATRQAFITNWAEPRDLVQTFIPAMARATGRSRSRVLATAITSGRRSDKLGPPATCEVAREASRRLGMPPTVHGALAHVMTMWNGKGYPDVAGEAIPLPTRVMHVASTAVLFSLLVEPSAAMAQVARRAGTYLDPQIVEALSPSLLDDIDEVDAYRAVLDVEPDPVRLVGEQDLEAVARTFGDIVDLKSPWMHGHSQGVGDLAAGAGQVLQLPQVWTLRVAGYLHDIGRVAISSRIWDKPGPLTTSERQQVELHPYHTEHILARIPDLAKIARLASEHHERCDGSGYHRGVNAASLTLPSRLLAAADRYRSLIEARPYRSAASATDAAGVLHTDVRAGRLDSEAVSAVLQAAGHKRAARRTMPAGLTDRQMDVLRLVSAGLSNRDIARELVISHRTAEHHIQDIYLKIGVSTRAGAALFAMEHGLLDKPG